MSVRGVCLVMNKFFFKKMAKTQVNTDNNDTSSSS